MSLRSAAAGLVVSILVGGVLSGCQSAPAAPPSADETASLTAHTSTAPPPPPTPSPAPVLAGVRVAIDPGHQLGNRNFPAQINRLVDAGGFQKACNSTGTATNSGYAEATFNFEVARRLATRLRALGATVRLTRTKNATSRWGPCIDQRGEFAAKMRADVLISIHGDGGPSSGHGFHVIAPALKRGWTDQTARPSARLAVALKRALTSRDFTPATYIAGGDGLDIRSDLGTLNHSDAPAVMLELGNMRNAGDAAMMTSAAGQTRLARAIAAGVRSFLRR